MFKKIIISLIFALAACNNTSAINIVDNYTELKLPVERLYYIVAKEYCNNSSFKKIINWSCRIKGSYSLVLTASTITFIDDNGIEIKQNMNNSFSKEINIIAQIGIDDYESGKLEIISFVQVLSKDVVLY